MDMLFILITDTGHIYIKVLQPINMYNNYISVQNVFKILSLQKVLRKDKGILPNLV